MLNAIRDSLSNHVLSDDEDDGEDKEDYQQYTEYGKLSWAD